ncbi:MAG: ComEC/Rec2 family competence protein [Coriobacteriia bacterium]
MPDQPMRPSIPATMWWCAALWTGAVAGEDAAWRTWSGAGVSPLAVALLAVCGALAGWVVWRRRHDREMRSTAALAVLLCAALLSGFGVSVLHGVGWRDTARRLRDAGAREWTGTVVADSREGQFGSSIRVRVHEAPYDKAVLTVYLPQGREAPELGRTVRFSAIAKVRETDDRGRRAARTGEHATATAWRFTDEGWCSGVAGALYRWRAGAAGRLEVVDGDPGALLRGIVLGDRRLLAGTAVDEDFRVLGLSHVVAVSGSHLAVVCALVLMLGTASGMPKRLVLAGVVCVACGYTVLSGLALSAVRSCVMLAAGAVAQCIGVRRDGVSGLALGTAAIVFASPWAVFDVGLALSVAAVGGLLVFGDLGVAWASAALPDALGKPAALLGGTLVAQGATLPIVTATFGMLSLAAPAANLVIVPAGEAALCVGLVGAALGGVWRAGGTVVVRLAGMLLGYATWMAARIAAVPSAAVSVGALGPSGIVAGAAVAVALWVRWPRPSRASARLFLGCIAAVTLAAGIGPRGPSECRVIVLDVGQADAILVQDGGDTMLVDAGADATTLRKALARYGVRTLDAVVLTHDHDDHIGGFGGLVGVVRVGWVGYPDVEGAAFSSVRDTVARLTPRGRVILRAVSAGQQWRVGDTAVRVLWPPAGATGLATNDTSIVLEIDAGQVEVVLTGDAEEAAQAGMAEQGLLHRVEVLKVPHHGSSNGLSQDGCAAWSPMLAVISVGTGNDFGHPASATLKMLARAGARVHRTDIHGDVVIEVTRRGYRVTPRQTSALVGLVMGRAFARRPCATIGPFDLPAQHLAVRTSRENDGRFQSRSAQARLPHTWQRGAAAGARAPPTEGHGRRRG